MNVTGIFVLSTATSMPWQQFYVSVKTVRVPLDHVLCGVLVYDILLVCTLFPTHIFQAAPRIGALVIFANWYHLFLFWNADFRTSVSVGLEKQFAGTFDFLRVCFCIGCRSEQTANCPSHLVRFG